MSDPPRAGPATGNSGGGVQRVRTASADRQPGQRRAEAGQAKNHAKGREEGTGRVVPGDHRRGLDGVEPEGEHGSAADDAEGAGQHRDAAGDAAVAVGQGGHHHVDIGDLKQAGAEALQQQSRNDGGQGRGGAPAADQKQPAAAQDRAKERDALAPGYARSYARRAARRRCCRQRTGPAPRRPAAVTGR